ncbi:hypothetical protein [Paraburkholderia tropica]
MADFIASHTRNRRTHASVLHEKTLKKGAEILHRNEPVERTQPFR